MRRRRCLALACCLACRVLLGIAVRSCALLSVREKYAQAHATQARRTSGRAGLALLPCSLHFPLLFLGICGT